MSTTFSLKSHRQMNLAMSVTVNHSDVPCLVAQHTTYQSHTMSTAPVTLQ